jgi:hypothetical protein
MKSIRFTSTLTVLFWLSIGISLSSCNFLFGTKKDDQVDDVLKQGAIDPTLNNIQVGYVPILPIWKDFMAPTDVFVGYDEMVYVVDQRGLVILDLKGEVQTIVKIPNATKVTQDRRLHTYVIGRLDTTLNGVPTSVSAIYHLKNTAIGKTEFVDTIRHYFDDNSRINTNWRGAADEAVQFTGLACTADNTLYVTRTGPTNNPALFSAPDNTVLFYNAIGGNIGYAIGLSPYQSSIKSCMKPNGICTFAAPPQLAIGMNTSPDFLMLQSDANAEYKVLWIMQSFNPESGNEYVGNAALLNFDQTKADGFLYQSFRFKNPSDICYAPDETRRIFVTDGEVDSVYQFTSAGFEGVNPPANTGQTKLIKTSFGGTGSGPSQFDNPSGVAYFRRVLYIADKGNNRIIRYKLSTDLSR